MKEKIKNVFFRFWYWYISSVDKNAELIFMNYGYSKQNFRIKLNEDDEKNRYSAQLYNFVATGVDVENKDILEIGSGRGGGLSYINRYLSPKSATGLDLSKKAIKFCNKYYSEENINFHYGNAQSLEFEDNTFDIVINVESSHRYNDIEKFLNEVYRVLKPGGYFLFTDFRHQKDIETLYKQVSNSQFAILKKEVITSNILEAIDLSHSDRIKLINNLAPKFLHGLSKKFAATKDTPTYNKFVNGEFEYIYKISRK